MNEYEFILTSIPYLIIYCYFGHNSQQLVFAAQTVLAPWTLHPVMGFHRKTRPDPQTPPLRRRSINLRRRKRPRRKYTS